MTRATFEATIAGSRTGLPSLFWKHFPASATLGEEAIAVHQEWMEETGAVLVKVMNEQLYPDVGPLPSGADWARVPAYPMSHPHLGAQTALVASLVERYGQTHPVLATIHGVTASAFHARGGGARYEQERHQLVDALRDDPDTVRAALERIADSLEAQARAYLDAGADGIFYAALGGERTLFTDGEFEQFIRPLDLRILEAIGEAGGLRYLHICKEDVSLDRYRDYPAEIVQAGLHSNDFGLPELRAAFPRAVLVSGFDHTDPVFVTGEDPAAAARAVLEQRAAVTGPVMVGADCSIPDHAEPARIAEIMTTMNQLQTEGH